jgi:hypothetical protein
MPAKSLGTIQKRLDISEYDIGIYTNSSLSLSLRNDHGKYSDVGGLNTIFTYKRSDSLVKITWDFSDFDFFAGGSFSNDILGNEVIVYQGLLNDDSTTMDLKDQNVSFNVLGLESILERATAPDWVGTPPANKSCSTLIKLLLNEANSKALRPVLTIDENFITPNNNILFDDLQVFENKTCREALNTILTASNSVFYIPVATPIVSGRGASPDVMHHFYGPAARGGPENIISIDDIRNGVNRTFNFVAWKDTNITSRDVSSISTYGVIKKELQIDGITTQATRQSIVDAIKTEFGNPKQEFKVTSPLNSATLALSLADKVDIDFPIVPVNAESLPLYGTAQYGASSFPSTLSSFQILTSELFKIIGSEIDAARNKCIFTLRSV